MIFKILNKIRNVCSNIAASLLKLESILLEKAMPSLILLTKPQDFPHKKIEVYILISSKSWMMGLWSAKSFQWVTKHTWSFVFQNDGTLTSRQINIIKFMFPKAVVIGRVESDAKMLQELLNFPKSLETRNKNILFLKLLDPFFYSSSDRYIVLDTDVLFFNYPKEIMEWCNVQSPDFRFNKDCGFAYSHNLSELKAFSKVAFPSLINTGLSLIVKKGINLNIIEEFLVEYEKS